MRAQPAIRLSRGLLTMKSARTIKAARWLLLGVLAAGTTQSAACSSPLRKFSSCEESRTCEGGEAGNTNDGGTAGSAPEGGAAGSRAAGEAADSGSAGTTNEADAGGSAGEGEPPLTCSDGFTTCTQGCVDTMSDRLNCGACAHSCLGGACTLGTCEAIPIEEDQGRLVTVSVDAQYVPEE